MNKNNFTIMQLVFRILLFIIMQLCAILIEWCLEYSTKILSKNFNKIFNPWAKWPLIINEMLILLFINKLLSRNIFLISDRIVSADLYLIRKL